MDVRRSEVIMLLKRVNQALKRRGIPSSAILKDIKGQLANDGYAMDKISLIPIVEKIMLELISKNKSELGDNPKMHEGWNL